MKRKRKISSVMDGSVPIYGSEISYGIHGFSAVKEITLDELYLLSRHYLEINNKPYKRGATDHKNCFKHRLSILVGQRGVGKTTLIVQYLLNTVEGDILSTKILYVPSDHFLLGKLSLYEIAATFSQLGGKVIAFDEIHKYSDWSRELKSIYDTFPELKIIASGSSALEVYKGSHDLTRRSIVYAIQGLSFREYLELAFNITFSKHSLSDVLSHHEKIVAEILKSPFWKEQKLLALFKKYLRSGYYPYFLEISDQATYFMMLEQNFHTIIESDLSAIYPVLTGNSIRKIKHLLMFIASSVPFMPQMNKLKNIIEVGDERTLKTYLKYLEDAGLIRMVMQASKKMRKIEIPEKIYLNNSNQLYAISANAQNVGTVREVFFLSMLSHDHKVTIPQNGDFLIDNNIVFEIGGKNKGWEQVKTEKNAYLVLDEIEKGIAKKIPLWVFGFLY